MKHSTFLWWLICAMSYYRHFGAKRRHAKTRQMLTFSSFRMATFRLATRKYATFHALRFRLLFVVSLPGEAKGRHAKKIANITIWQVFAWRPFAFLSRKHVNTIWHKSATILFLKFNQ